VVLAAEGYPAAPKSGDAITGLEAAEREGALVFHAGTRLDGGAVVTSGGRVLTVVGQGASLAEARALAYRAATHVRFRGAQLRADIGHRALGPR
jgi:phosphoribosylamine--glycine ligase